VGRHLNESQIGLLRISKWGSRSSRLFVHDMTMGGPPGTGRTLLSILPKMSINLSLEITRIYSVQGGMERSKYISIASTRTRCELSQLLE